MFHIVKYIYNHTPSSAWGSPEIVANWYKLGGMEGIIAKNKKEKNND